MQHFRLQNMMFRWEWYNAIVLTATALFLFSAGTAVAGTAGDAAIAEAKRLTDRGNSQGALRVLKRALEAEPSNPSLWVALGDVHRDLWSVKEAIADYNRALAVDAKFFSAYKGRAKGYEGREDYDRAIAYFSTYLRHNPTDANAYGE